MSVIFTTVLRFADSLLFDSSSNETADFEANRAKLWLILGFRLTAFSEYDLVGGAAGEEAL